MQPTTFCAFCGVRFPEGLGWPRTCPACHSTTYRNPLPVAVVLVPVNDGLLVRRSIAPQAGKLALPGGYINLGEMWQEAGAREVTEETGVQLDPASIRDFGVRSAPDGAVLILGLSHPVERVAVDAFAPTAETSECTVIDAPVRSMAFPLHEEAVSAFFNQRTDVGLAGAPK